MTRVQLGAPTDTTFSFSAVAKFSPATAPQDDSSAAVIAQIFKALHWNQATVAISAMVPFKDGQLAKDRAFLFVRVDGAETGADSTGTRTIACLLLIVLNDRSCNQSRWSHIHH